MLRTFETHKVRKTRELSGRLWKFTALGGENAGKTIKAVVPSCWETYPGYERYRGAGVYRTSFSAQGNIRLEFKGVSHTAEVFLDGRQLCSHYNAYTAFDCTAVSLSSGEHTLEVRTDNSFGEHSALHVPNDYMSYGGISRPVVLETISDLFIEAIHTEPFSEDSIWKAHFDIRVRNIGKTCGEFELHLNAAGRDICLSGQSIGAGEVKTLSCTMEFSDVVPWNVGEPNLYYVQAEIWQNGTAIDDLIDRFGFREVKISGDSILINGRNVRIKGVCRHEDHPHYGCALPLEAMQYDISTIKHLGANSIRTSHYPNDERFLDLCDEQGILVWEENHARGLSAEQMKNPNFGPQAENVIREMIDAHFNHPCIYIWGILNECASDDPYGRECYAKQFELIRQMDTSRPTTFASCRTKSDICLDLPEVVSFNIYPQWYLDTPVADYLSDLYEWIQCDTCGSGKPFIVSEIGAGGIYGYRNHSMVKWTEDYQAVALEKQLSGVLSFADCQGVYIWQFCDISISDEWWNGRPRTMNNKGLVDEYRRRKLAFEVVRRIFSAYSDFFD